MVSSSHLQSPLGPTTAEDYHTLLESFAGAIWETDPQGKAVTDSPSWRTYTDQSLQQWLSDGPLGAVHPDQQVAALNQWQQALGQRTPFHAQVRLSRPEGGWRWTTLRAVPTLHPDGSVKKWLCVALNSSDCHKEATAGQQSEGEVESLAAQLADNQQLLQATLDSSLDLIQVFRAVRDASGQITDFVWVLNNQAAQRVYGDVLGKSLVTLNLGVVEESIFDTFRRVVETGLPDQSERHYVHEQFDGWFYQSTVKLGDGVATTTTDITARKLAEEQLEQSQAFLQSVIDSSLDVIQVFSAVRDEAGTIVDFVWVMNNQKAVAQNGDVIGKSLLERNPGVVPTGVFSHMVEVAQTGIAYEHEQYYDHEQFEGWFYQALVKTGEGVTMTTRDISRQKQAEAEILRLKEEIIQKATDKYRILFEAIDEGFAVLELVFDGHGEVADLIYHEANAAFAQHTGLGDVMGKRASQVFPHTEQAWFEALKQVYQTGVPLRTEGFNTDTQRWFTAHYSLVGGAASPLIAAVFQDITDRKRREANLSFLAGLMSDFAPLSTVEEIMNLAGTRLVNHLGLSHCFFVEVNQEEGECTVLYHFLPTDEQKISGTYKLEAFHTEEDNRILASGQSMVVNNVEDGIRSPGQAAAYKALDIGAVINTPHIDQGRWVFDVGIGRRHPCVWQPDEIELMQEVSARVWIRMERAKAEEALRKSEEQFRRAIQDAPIPVIMHAQDGEVLQVSSSWTELTGYTLEDKAVLQTWLTRAYGFGGEEVREAMAHSFAPQPGQPMRAVIFDITTRQGEHRRWSFSASTPGTLRDGRRFVVGMAEDITERARAEEALRESEKRLRLAIEATELATWEWNLETGEVYWNERHFRLFGLEPRANPISPEDFFRHVHPQEQQRLRNLLEQAVAQRSVYDTEFCAVLEDGSQRWMSGYGRITEERDGRPIRLSGVMQDITDRRQAEEDRRQSEERYRTLLQNLPDYAIFRLDTGGIITEWTDGAGRVKGYSADEAVGQPLSLFYPPEEQAAGVPQAELAEAAQTGRTEREGWRIRKDGAWFLVNETCTAIYDPSGQVVGFTKISRDITARKEAEEALRDSRQRLQIVMDSIADHAIITHDPQGLITGWNTGAQQMFGYGAQEALGQPDEIIFTPEDRAAGVAEAERQTARRQGQAPDERDHLRRDGSRIYVSGVQSPLYDEAGGLLGYVKVARDLSERRQMEEALREADRRKDEFLAMLAHELRNPMATIRNGLHILTLTAPDHTTQSTVGMMNRQTDHLVRMLDDLLDVSRISRGKIELQKARVNLVDLVQQAAKSLQPQFEQQGKTLQVDLPTVPVELMGDATQLTQVVTNLLTNGLRYTGDGGTVWLEVTRQQEANGSRQALIKVRDNGIGLAADQLSAIFDLFVQVDNSPARSKGGLGLGLTLVKRLVELHGGEVKAHSEGLGKGSTFTISLPTLPVVNAEEAKPATEPTDEARAMRLLVIDDNPDVAMTLGMLLKLKGYEVHTRHSGRAGLEAAQDLRPDAVLLDIGMPEMDGYETCRALRQQAWGQDLVVIALTGYGGEEDQQRTREAGFDGHLVKPVDLKDLMNLLADLSG